MITDNHFLNSFLKSMTAEATAFSLAFPLHVTIIEPIRNIASPTDYMTFPAPPQTAHPPSRPSPTGPMRSADQSPVTPQDVPRRKSLPKQSSGFSSPTHTTPISPVHTPTPHYVVPPKQEVKATQDKPATEVRAYQYTGPIELPTRMPTHRPQQSIPSVEFEEGLHVVEATEFQSTSDYEAMMGTPQLGLRPLSPQPSDAQSISNLSSVGTISGKPFKGLFGRFGGSKRPPPSPLPTSLEFCFSNCAKQIVFWCRRNPDSIVRLPYPFETARRCEMLVPDQLVPAPNRQQTRSIRLLAASADVAVAIVHIEEVSKNI